ncbi:hypothetical protein Q1695_003714 [Nippostrongylus brasiliensis]|nr:hypothetical protein Q1695_003714 [Nippostrongylus brasiliensis]
MRKRYVFFVSYNVCEIVNAFSYILVGIGGAQENAAGTLHRLTTVRNCFFHKYWPQSMIVGTESITLCIILISIERFLAIVWPNQYKVVFCERNKMFYLCLIPTIAAVSLAVAALSAHLDGGRVVRSQHCFISDSTALWYSTFHFIFIVAGFFGSFLSFVTAWLLTRKVPAGKKNRLGLWVGISGWSTLVIFIPSAVMLYMSWMERELNDVFVYVANSLPGFLSLAYTVYNFTVHKQFRLQLVRACVVE